MILPQGLMHFLVNTGKAQALVRTIFNSPKPDRQILVNALFGNNLPSEFIEKITLIDVHEVRRLKALLGGSG